MWGGGGGVGGGALLSAFDCRRAAVYKGRMYIHMYIYACICLCIYIYIYICANSCLDQRAYGLRIRGLVRKQWGFGVSVQRSRCTGLRSYGKCSSATFLAGC